MVQNWSLLQTGQMGGNLLHSLLSGVPKKSGNVQEILFGLSFVKPTSCMILTACLVGSWGFVVSRLKCHSQCGYPDALKPNNSGLGKHESVS